MAWTTIVLVSTGELATASVQNTQVLGNLNELRTGGLAISSQAALDFIYASSASQLARLAAGTAYQAPRINSGANGWEFADPFLKLLKANSGTTTNTSAENVDTVAITGLTAKDTILVYATLAAVTQPAGNVDLYNNTDSVSILRVATAASDLQAGDKTITTSTLRQLQAAATDIAGHTQGKDIIGDTAINNSNNATFTTNWTGSWTLALRQAGVTAGGTLRWSWTVFKVAGQ